MKVGDLVTWHSNFFDSAQSNYANPGLLVEDLGPTLFPHTPTRRFRILWADGRQTTEHSGYLTVISESR